MRILNFYISDVPNVKYNQDRLNLYQNLGLNEGKFDQLVLHGTSGSFLDLETLLARVQGETPLGSEVSESTGFKVKVSFFKMFLLKSFEEISKAKNVIDNQKIESLKHKCGVRRYMSERSWFKVGLEQKTNFYTYMLKKLLMRIKKL